jgi:hypothetical protein
MLMKLEFPMKLPQPGVKPIVKRWRKYAERVYFSRVEGDFPAYRHTMQNERNTWPISINNVLNVLRLN